MSGVRRISDYLWKLLLCGWLYAVAFTASVNLIRLAGLEPPPTPGGSPPPSFQMFLLATPLLALALALVARSLRGPAVERWLALFVFLYVGHGINTAIETAVFMTTGGTLATIASLLLPCLLCTAATMLLFAPRPAAERPGTTLRDFLARRAPLAWSWRLPAAWLAFPLVYLFFGALASPFVLEYYRSGVADLVLPEPLVILAVQLGRGALYLAACLPVLALWAGSRRGLTAVLGFALFVLAGGFGMSVATFFPAAMRVAHSVEILLDSLVFAAALVALLWRPGDATAAGGARDLPAAA
jgi:hypothetical protein